MEPTKIINTLPDEHLNDVDQADLEAFAQKRLEEAAGRSGSSAKLESLRILGNVLVLFVLGLFIVSPCLQMFLRIINGIDDQPLFASSTFIQYYQQMIRNIHYTVRFTAVIILLLLILYYFVRRKKYSLPLGRTDKKQFFKRLIPLLVFWLFALDIALVTVLRGPNEYDLTGHPYMFESIYSYITYPLIYFTCGVLLYREKHKKLVIYALLFSALPVNLLALYDQWFFTVNCFNGAGVCAVFHNSNHYGYYLAIVILSGFLMFAHEKNSFLRNFSGISAVIATILLIINDTLGAYLAVLFALILYVIYCTFIIKRDKLQSIGILGVFLFITFIMSFRYSTVFSNFLTLFNDIGEIVSDPLEADSAGSFRWARWKNTISHMGESPWLGFGVEGMLNTYHIGTAHNEFLQYAAFFGIPASLLYIIACSMVLIRVFKKCKTMSNTTMLCFFVSIGYLASSFFGVAIYYTTPFIYIFLGLTYAEYLKS